MDRLAHSGDRAYDLTDLAMVMRLSHDGTAAIIRAGDETSHKLAGGDACATRLGDLRYKE
jgi:hypothetical protein